MKAGRIVFGTVALLVGLASFFGSLSILTNERDADDYFISQEQKVDRSSFAVISEDVDVLTAAPGWLADWLTDPVDVRITGTAANGRDVFFGIADTAELSTYLTGVGHDEVTSLDFEGDNIVYIAHEGSGDPALPAEQSFWAASVAGGGQQTLDWSLETGNWSVAVMNADGSAGIDVDLVFGARISNFVALSWIGLGFGVLATLGGAYLLFSGIRRSDRDRATRIVDLRDAAAPAKPEVVQEKPTAKT